MEIGLRALVNLRHRTFYVDVERGPYERTDIKLYRAVAAACQAEHGRGQLFWDGEFVPEAPPDAFTWVRADGTVRLSMTATVRCGVYHLIPANVELTFEEYASGAKAAWDAMKRAVELECRRQLGSGILSHVRDNEFRWERF